MINCLRISLAYRCPAHRWARKDTEKPLSVTCHGGANGWRAAAGRDAAVPSAVEEAVGTQPSPRSAQKVRAVTAAEFASGLKGCSLPLTHVLTLAGASPI